MTSPAGNTPQLWDKLWDQHDPRQAAWSLAREEKSIQWARIHKTVAGHFGNLENLKVIEIGAGTGKFAIYMARQGAKITILDFSDKALDHARRMFDSTDIKADFIKADALDLPAELKGQFDVAMSYGLVEHFTTPQRAQVVQAHADLVRPGGMLVINAPNRYCPTYRLFRILAKMMGQWNVGIEIPFSRKEFRAMCQTMGITDYSIFGDSFAGSFELINPMRLVRKILNIKPARDTTRIRQQRGSRLDATLGRALILCAVRPEDKT